MGLVPLIRFVDAFNIPSDEFQALQDLYDSTNGADWVYGPPADGAEWNFTTGTENPCTENWQGITCTNNCSITPGCNIEVIYMPGFNMVGALPESMGNFSLLTQLQLHSNKLSSSIPSTFGKLSSLYYWRFDNNILDGCIPPSIGSLTMLINMNIGYNSFSCSIPSTLGSLTRLTLLGLLHNELVGQMPTELGGLSKLISLSLFNNQLSGSVPTEFGQFSGLQEMNIDYNFLEGRLPSELGQLSTLQSLNVYANLFTGPLPDSLGHLAALDTFNIFSNQLSGELPDSLGGMTSVTYFSANANAFTGQLPSSLGSIHGLRNFYLFDNLISGSLPSSFSQISELRFLDIDSNFIGGSLPSELFGVNMTHVYYFDLFDNRFTGSIPPTISNMVSLQFVYLFDNFFDGSLPSALGTLTNLQEFVANDNSFTGCIPPELGSAAELATLYLYNNLLSCSLPSALGSLQKLINFNMSSNGLSGTLPTSFGNLSSLVSLDLSYNGLVGEIPEELNNIAPLSVVFLQSNSLEGELGDFINPSLQVNISDIDLGDNQFTGAIPIQPFAAPALLTFAAVGNCFQGMIPEDICSARNLTALAFDGMTSADACRRRFFPTSKRFTSYSLNVLNIHGSVPLCLFAMPALNTLHLSGNALTGSVPNDVVISPSLTDLSLSHNFLSGVLPDVIQERAWDNLDLSFNKISGILSPNFMAPSNDSVVSLEVNRLSGVFPVSLRHASTINVLSGNMFECDSVDTLPDNDPDRGTYSCGSDAFDTSVFVWLGLYSAFLCAFCYQYSQWKKQQMSSAATTVDSELDNTSAGVDNTHQFDFFGVHADIMNVFVEETSSVRETDKASERVTTDTASIRSFGAFMVDMRRLVVGCTAVVLVLLVPVYVSVSTLYSIYVYQYVWVVSAAYVSGLVPGLIFFVVFAVFLFLLAGALAYRQNHDAGTIDNSAATDMTSAETDQLPTSTTSWGGMLKTFRYNLSFVLVAGFNCALMLSANMAFVYVTVTYDLTIITVSQLALSIFKIIWNGYIVSMLVIKAHTLNKELDKVYSGAAPTAGGSGETTEASYLMFHAFMVLFNDIACPYLATASISSNCFLNVLIAPPLVESSYEFIKCEVTSAFDHCSLTTSVHDTSYLPPYKYSYQCSSTLVSSYASVYVYAFIMLGLGTPLLDTLMKALHTRLLTPPAEDVQPSAAALTTAAAIEALLPLLLLPLRSEFPKPVEGTTAVEETEKVSNPVHSPALETEYLPAPKTSSVGVSVVTVENYEPNREAPLLFPFDEFIVQMVSSFTLLVTFGAVFPPLAVVICVALLSQTYYAQILVGQLAAAARTSGLPAYILVLDRELDGASRAFYSTIWLVIPMAAVIFSFYIFDTVGDAVDWTTAVLSAVSIVVLSLLLWLIFPWMTGRS